ncbi:DUF2088 domain-containing protein [Geodermatophilus sp. DSM 44513]|uniref:DUF2088 domain-containing protein n=1 Tax=Geodermatophilus sp. DSM 44513 TaxID=1528104 RepID=UPI00126B6D29|nr:DUF2088 domain-containing protein [Geodermatophilus sp. DSM 44513]WNV75077.1 hypothetical protein RTG05_19115 [Geodermatophilus sp. DSM 44513]
MTDTTNGEPVDGRPRLPALALADIVHGDVDLPPLVRVRRVDRATPAVDLPAMTRAALGPACALVRPGDSIALAVGSRGIAGIQTIVQSCVSALREAGGEPFIVPAMGSHGGATPAGQQQVLAGLGITEESVGAPVRAAMETLVVGAADGVEVHVDRQAAAADHVLLVNRLKSHTSFSGRVESGLAKMLAIGLGKQRGAEELHRRGPAHLEARILTAGGLLKGALPLLGGLAVVEDAHKSVHRIELLQPAGIGGDQEAELLEVARSLEARLPFGRLDVLVVDLMGKEISGTGMDTNVLGRRMVRGMPEPPGLQVTNVVVLDVSPGSGGNAVGIGLADFAPSRALERVDLAATYANAMTAGLQGVQRAQLPIVLATDRDAIHAAVLTAGLADTTEVRMARIRSTVHLDELMVSPCLLQECAEHYEPVDTADGAAWDFSADGAVTGWPVAPASPQGAR